jgi:hypothetical protein
LASARKNRSAASHERRRRISVWARSRRGIGDSHRLRSECGDRVCDVGHHCKKTFLVHHTCFPRDARDPRRKGAWLLSARP